jgi:hypothetical protein
MEEDFDDEYVDDDIEYEEEDTINNELEDELEEEGEDDIEDDVSEIYRPKVEKKIDPIAKMNVKPRSVIIVPPENRITDNRLHENEASFILSTRAEEIAKNATCFANNKTYTNDKKHIKNEDILKVEIIGVKYSNKKFNCYGQLKEVL